MAKISELWQEVERAQSEHTASGARMSIIEAHKILEILLDSKGFLGKTIQKKLFWAGYSGKDREGITEALQKHDEIISKFEYVLSDFEAEEITKTYHEIIQEIMKEPSFGFVDKMKALAEVYLSPKSVLFWKWLGIIVGIFIGIKLLAYTEIGKQIVGLVVGLADFVISWMFVAIILVFAAGFIGIKYYFDNRSKVRIKED
jgi:hypothetical protein